MLTKLIIRYFFRNKKRTYRAVIILSIGLALVLSTDMLLSGYINQIDQFASLIEDDGNQIIITNSNNDIFSEELETQINSALDDYQKIIKIKSSSLEIITDVNTTTKIHKNVHIKLINTTQIIEQGWINISSNQSNEIFINEQSNLHLESNFSTSFYEHQYNISRYNQFEPIKSISADIIIDKNSRIFNNSFNQRNNRMEIILLGNIDGSQLAGQLSNLGLQVNYTSPSTRFLKITADQITNILILLQFGMSILLILSIAYVMITLINESAKDIRIFNMIGLVRKDIFSIFMGQTLIVSIAASFVSVLFSIVFLYSILPFITLLGLPYGTLAVNLDFIVLTSFQALIVGIIAGLIPSLKGAGYID